MSSRVDPATLSQEIDETRADVGETLDALQAKLSPGQLFDQAVIFCSEQGYEIAHRLGRTIREHPMPVAIAGTGLLWYLSVRRRRGTYDWDEDYEYRYEHGPDSDDTARESQSLRDRARQASGEVRRRARRAGDSFSQLLYEQPLLVGAVGVALGAVIAAALPSSETEDELLGELSDRAVERAKKKGSEQYEKVRETVKRAAESARRAASEPDAGGSPSRTQPGSPF